jgi:hypothetical protein
MNAIARQPNADPLFVRPSPQRPAYATGMLLDAGDFLDEQTYHRGRLAQALAFLSGGGTLAGLRVSHHPAADGEPEEIHVEAGLAVDRLGRLIELPRPACLRLERWWETQQADDGGDDLTQASYDDLAPLLSTRAQAEAGSDGSPPIPGRAVVADVFVRFIACEQGLTPGFASGPFDALDAVTTSRLQDAYELLLLPRPGLDVDDPSAPHTGLPVRGPDLAAIVDADERSAALQDAVLDAWPAGGRAGSAGQLDPLAEHPTGTDPTAQFLARVLIPVNADTPPGRDGSAVIIDNWARRFVPSAQLIQRCLGV